MRILSLSHHFVWIFAITNCYLLSYWRKPTARYGKCECVCGCLWLRTWKLILSSLLRFVWCFVDTVKRTAIKTNSYLHSSTSKCTVPLAQSNVFSFSNKQQHLSRKYVAQSTEHTHTHTREHENVYSRSLMEINDKFHRFRSNYIFYHRRVWRVIAHSSFSDLIVFFYPSVFDSFRYSFVLIDHRFSIWTWDEEYNVRCRQLVELWHGNYFVFKNVQMSRNALDS